MVEMENVSQWQGQDVVDADGDKIGKLKEIYVDTETDQPMFGAVQVGIVGNHRWAFMPLQGATAGQDYLQVQVDKKQVKKAPSVEPKSDLPKDDEENIYTHYGMQYAPPANPAGRRLARR